MSNLHVHVHHRYMDLGYTVLIISSLVLYSSSTSDFCSAFLSQVLRVPHRASQRDVGGDAFQWQNYGFELLLGVLCVGCA